MSIGRHLVVVAAVAALAMSGCGEGEDGDQDATPTTSATTATSTTEPRADVTAALTLQMEARNNSGQSGTASLTATADGKTRVVLDLANSPAGPQPSHINSGTCDALGDIAYILGGLRSGKVEATVDASVESLLAGAFAVSVAKSPQEFGVIVSCVDIERT